MGGENLIPSVRCRPSRERRKISLHDLLSRWLGPDGLMVRNAERKARRELLVAANGLDKEDDGVRALEVDRSGEGKEDEGEEGEEGGKELHD